MTASVRGFRFVLSGHAAAKATRNLRAYAKFCSVSRVAHLRFIPPQLATSVDQPPEGEHWIHEMKHDGYRCQVLVERGQARVLTRTGLDWSEHYPDTAHSNRLHNNEATTALRWPLK